MSTSKPLPPRIADKTCASSRNSPQRGPPRVGRYSLARDMYLADIIEVVGHYFISQGAAPVHMVS